MKLLPLLFACAFGAGSISHAAAPAKEKSKATSKVDKKVDKKFNARAKRPVKLIPRRVTPPIDYAGEQINFGQWKEVADFADGVALRHGFPRAELSELIGKIRYIDSAVQLVKPFPSGKPKNWQAYKQLTIEPIRIGAGVKFWNEQGAALARAEAEYGVPAEIIAGIIGVETVYGRDTGRFRVLDVLTTLAFAYPETPNRAARMAFFRGELENALLLARKNGIDPFSLLGSFAGAIGMPQFMPGSVLAYAVDFDGDGQVDLRNSAVDAIGSVANFLVVHGWKRHQAGRIAYPVDVAPSRVWESFIGKGLSAQFTPEQLATGGVALPKNLPAYMLFGLVDLQNGDEATEYWLASDNFFAITQYNRSYFYAMSVVELGRALRSARVAQGLVSPETL